MSDLIQQVRDVLFDAVCAADQKGGGSSIPLQARQAHRLIDALAAAQQAVTVLSFFTRASAGMTTGGIEYIGWQGQEAKNLRQHLEAARKLVDAATPQHPDDAAVDALAVLMKANLAKQRAKGYGGWDTDCTQERLSELLRQHVDKGDPVDVANFCAFLQARGEGISAAPQAVQPAVPVNLDFDTLRAMLGALSRAWGDAMNCAYCPGSEPHREAMRRVRNTQAGVTRYIDAMESCVAPAHPAEGVPAQDMVSVKKEDANAFCRILTALGIEEEGDPVAEVQRLLAATQPAAQGLKPCKPIQPEGMTSINARLSFNFGWLACERHHGIRPADVAEALALVAAQAKQGGA